MDAAPRPPDTITPTRRPWIATVIVASALAVLFGIVTVVRLQHEAADAVIVPAAIAAFLAFVVVRILRTPERTLTIADDQIAFGGIGSERRVITRTASGGSLQLFDHGRIRGVFLEPTTGGSLPIVIGASDVARVRAACEAHGWTFAKW